MTCAALLSNDAKHVLKQAPWILKDEEEESKPAEQTHGPAQRTLSRIMRNIAKIEAAERWTHSNEKEKERRPEAGAQELVELGAHHRTARSCQTHTGERQHKRESGASTSHRTSNAGSRQMEVHHAKQHLTKVGHSQLCKLGPARRRPHRAVQTTLGGLLRNTGAHVDLERASPELFTWHGQKFTEAILDAASRWPTSLHTTVFDITVRCPHALRYGGDVTASPTAAAEDEKHKRYGPQVTPIAFSAALDEKEEMQWKHWQLKHAGTPMTRAINGARWQYGETPWNRVCCTRKQTSCSSPSALRDAQDGKNGLAHASEGSALQPYTRTSYPTSRW